jgi:hypothetical protein
MTGGFGDRYCMPVAKLVPLKGPREPVWRDRVDGHALNAGATY